MYQLLNLKSIVVVNREGEGMKTGAVQILMGFAHYLFEYIKLWFCVSRVDVQVVSFFL